MHVKTITPVIAVAVTACGLLAGGADVTVAHARTAVSGGTSARGATGGVVIRPSSRRGVAREPGASGTGRVRPWSPSRDTPGADLSPGNVASLEMLWDVPTTAGVTAGPIVTDDTVYAASWDSNLYALDPDTGDSKWVFDGDAFLVGSPTLLDDGDLVFGDWLSNVYRVDGTTGELVWQTTVGDTAVDSVWSSVSVAAGRVFVGIASHTDVPCTKGRTVALDVETGDVLWERMNVPDRICDTDTTRECASDDECDGGTCIEAIGAGVTAMPAPDAAGEFVYVNTVGCYTYPSVGDSDAMMKLDAETGETIWLNRVDEPEQFGFCTDDPPVECSTNLMCTGTGGACQEKGVYHDFGFLNGPLLIEVPGVTGPTTLVVSGSKNGTLYAFDPDDGEIVWTNEIAPKPVSPGFAAWGLFNGALGYDGDRIYAALHGLTPDPDPDRENLQAYDPRDGSTVWTAPFEQSWAHAGVGQGIVVSGSNAEAAFFCHDARTGRRLASFPLPATTVSRAAIVGDRLYIGYGITTNAGGVRAYALP